MSSVQAECTRKAGMMMELKDMIFRRRSVRAYEDVPLDEAVLADIRSFIAGMKPLYANICVHSVIVGRDQVQTLQNWEAPHFLAIFSEEKPGWLENVGFLFQQLDLYLQLRGLGCCWVGLGWLNDEASLCPDGMRFAILMPFGKPRGDGQRNDVAEFKRKAMADITDQPDERLEAVRVAPSATNSQPWYITHDGDVLHFFREELGIVKRRTHGKYNLIDMGIALAHLYIAFGPGFTFWKEAEPPEKPGYFYIGSVKLE